MNNDDITLRIANAVLPHRKRSERMIGYLPYTLDFEMRHYHGVSQKPEKISVLEKTIVNLIGKNVTDTLKIAKYLGLDTSDEIEHELLFNAIDGLKTRLQLVSGRNNQLMLTSSGVEFNRKGVLTKTFSRSFDLLIAPANMNFPHLSDCVEPNKSIKFVKAKENLSISQIKFFAEYQATFVQYAENGMELITADLDGIAKSALNCYVCFIQSIRDNSVRTIIYDRMSNSVIEPLSEFFDSNLKLRDDLLKQCLDIEVKNEDAKEVDSDEKTAEQIVSEQKIIEEADLKGEDITEGKPKKYDDKIGTIYDSAEFERELQEIFESHHNDEIWLISPWIKKYAFLNVREPQIRRFLDQGGAIFIGYSLPERPGEEMVDQQSMSIVKRLDSNYDKFYYAELPKFHMKNVIELKGKVTTLYSGSFNILSFCINGSDEHYRMEQMTFANRKEAEERRVGYLKQFSERYVKEYIEKIKLNSGNNNVNLAKLDYLRSTGVLDDVIESLQKVAKEVGTKVVVNAKPDENGLIEIAKNVVASRYEEDYYKVQARLASLNFLFEIAKKRKDNKMLLSTTEELHKLFGRNSIYRICRFALRRGKENKNKSILNIICNGFNFEFSEILIQQSSFKTLQKHKEIIDFKAENLRLVRNNISEVLYNSCKAIGAIK